MVLIGSTLFLLISLFTAKALLERNRARTEGMVREVSAEVGDLSRRVVDEYGKQIVELKARTVAQELSHRLWGRDTTDYEALRADDELRALATEPVEGWEADAGYVDVYDREGVAVWHPKRDLEGMSFAVLKDQHPRMWELVELTFTQDNVAGYYDFPNEKTGEVERKYMFVKHIPGTRLAVAATVRIATFFDPVEAKLDAANQQVRDELFELSARHSREFVSSFLRISLVGGGVVALVGVLLGVWFSGVLARPILALEQVAEQMQGGDFRHTVPEFGPHEVAGLARVFNHLAGHLTELLGRIKDLADHVSETATGIEQTAVAEERRLRDLGASTTQIATTTKQISATSEELANTVSDVTGRTAETATLAGQGQEALAGVAAAMAELREASAEVADGFTLIRAKARDISGILGMIGKVADQTNLLSLNAHIAAEEAGEHGLEFSGVAREMRRLADHTSVSARDIAKMIQAMETAVQAGAAQMGRYEQEVAHGVATVQRITDQLEQITANVQELTPRLQAVDEGMRSQAEGASEISAAVMHLDATARRTGESVAQFRRATGNLNEAVALLNGQLSRFQTGG
jgi:methyl-accepting chemotaxis protein WspA